MSIQEKTGVAVLGAGTMARNHMAAFRRCGAARLLAVCDTDTARAAAAAQEYGIPWSGSNINAVLACPEIKAVSIVTPAFTHYDLVLQALAAGKHVLCEKPPALSAEQAEEMQRAAEACGKTLMYGFVRRFAGNTAYLRRQVENGRLGNIYSAKAGILRRCGHPGGWYSDKSAAGGGALMDIGIHMLDLCLYLMGEPVPTGVMAHTFTGTAPGKRGGCSTGYRPADNAERPVTTEEFSTLLIRLSNGASLSLEACWAMHRKEDAVYCELYGTEGGARLEPELELYRDQDGTPQNIQPVISSGAFAMDDSLMKEVSHFLACASGTEECLCPAWTGTRAMRVIEAAYRSAESGHSERVY